MDWDAMVTVGRVVRPRGNRGEVIIASQTDVAEERFRPGATVWTARQGVMELLTVATSREHDGRWVVGFAGVGTIDAAEALRDVDLRIEPERIAPLSPDAFYVHDLIGCEVRTTGGARVGVVGKVDPSGGLPMLVVGEGAEEVLVPFTAAICRRVDLDAKVIEIDPPEGLIDLNRR